MSDPRVIISLDYSDSAPVLALLDKLNPAQCRVKVGKELFTSTGPDLVREIQRLGFSVFLDLKFHDIPTTVARACAAAADLGVWMLNVHASGGKNMLLAAREAIETKTNRPLLIAVTVLTSMSAEDLEQTGVGIPVTDQVLNLATLAQNCGLDGVVCSARETGLIMNRTGTDFKLVTPGIRPAGVDNNDQQRVMTPAAAIQSGSHYLVIGRPITQASDPVVALDAINQEIKSVTAEE